MKPIVIILILLTVWRLASATVYYVATTGNDANTSVQAQNPATPWATATHAAGVVAAGDTVNVAKGWYLERVPLAATATPASPITWLSDHATNWGFVGSQDVSAQVISGFYVHNTNAYGSTFDTPDFSGIYCRGAYWLITNNFLWENGQQGIVIDGRTNAGFTGVYSNTIVNNLSWTNGQSACQIGGTNNIVLSNDFGFSTRFTIYNTSPNAGWDGDGMYYFGSGHIIRSNYIHGVNASDPKNSGAHCDGIQTWGIQAGSTMGYSHDCLIDGNTIDGTINGVMVANGNGIFQEGCSNIYVMNNVIRWHRGTTFTTVSYCPKVYNNTFVGQTNDAASATFGTVGFPLGLGTCSNAGPNLIIWQNNIAINWTNVQFVPGTTYSGLVSDHNLKYRMDGVAVGEDSTYAPFTANDLENVDPKLSNAFANPPNAALLFGSGSIDSGTNLTGIVTNDIVGVTRPVNAIWDIGAFEFPFAPNTVRTIGGLNSTTTIGPSRP